MKRRDFMKLGALGGLGMALRPTLAWAAPTATGLRKFIQPLPGLGAGGIPLATNKAPAGASYDYYEMEAGEYRHQFHPDLLPSKVWGYADLGGAHGYLGGVIVAQKDRPVRLRVRNRLPSVHPLPVDTTIMGADLAPNRISVHLHGGFVPWTSDGGPWAWFDPNGNVGQCFMNAVAGQPGVGEYYYPNQQSARLMWYHDHAMGITRLNAYAGLATGYLVTDDVEQSLIASRVLPDVGIPLIIQDKSFVDRTSLKAGYRWGQLGDLWYPCQYDPADLDPAYTGTTPVPSCVPEFFGDYPMVNGAVSPHLEVEQRHYRFRILNGAQASFYNLQLYYADGSGEAANLARPGPAMLQIGTEGGFLPAAVLLNDPPRQIGFDPTTGNATRYTLLVAPGERADIVIDFSNVPAGSKLILYNDAPRPFPGGVSPDSTPLATILQFRVVPRRGAADPASMATRPQDLVGKLPRIPILDPRGATPRNLTLNEDYDELGRLIQRLGTNKQNGFNTDGQPTWGRNYTDAPTEIARVGAVEFWNIFNLTGDVHPIHFHLTNVQVIARQPFASWNNGSPRWAGPAYGPDANERGWKETVRMNPGECTTVIMKFDLPNVPFKVPPSPRTGGHEYVWHCHILEHEEHDMMRPLVVRP